jgi:ABC-type bacteriocin/lantibiotic exporter with double-glycine peptidase domain
MNLIPDRRQRQDDWHCGPVIAATMLDLCGFGADDATSRVALGLPVSHLDGVDPRTLESFLRKQGCGIQSGEMNVRDLAHHTRQGRPVACLICENGGHWVAVLQTSRNCVEFHDPLNGLRRLGKVRFAEVWHDTDRFACEYRNFGIACWRG